MSERYIPFPEHTPLDAQQLAALKALSKGINDQQATWLSGFFAGLGQGVPAAEDTSLSREAPLTILYGSESGNAGACASDAAKAAKAAGFKASVVDMAEFSTEQLAKTANLLVIVSTWGEGDPPETAVPFHEAMMSDKAPRLPANRFAVFALGDTSYADFCECGKQFDRRLEELGGKRILNRVDADVDYEESFQQWLDQVMPKMAEETGAFKSNGSGTAQVAEAAPRIAPTQEFGKKHPFPAPVTQLINLNGRGSAKHTAHVEFSLEGSGLSYLPGDVVGIFPENCPEVVDDLLRVAHLGGDEPVSHNDRKTSLRNLLLEAFDITSVNVSLMKKYHAVAGNPELSKLLEPDNKGQLKEWIEGREVSDLLEAFPPAKPLAPETLLGFLRKMPPRLYSIASSLKAHPGEVHLTVGAVRYDSHGRKRKGVCSTYLCERIHIGDSVRLYTHHNKNFFLPEDPDVPIIMVGPGTGIAPFRAFMEEREAIGAKGRNWLFFGDQHFNSDFLYQLEWQDYLKKGILTRMDVAFSRDTENKVYVQHRMKEQARDLYAWLQDGAYFYVCGDASRMARDVHQALIDIFAEQGGLAQEAAETSIKELQKSKRYQRDVY